MDKSLELIRLREANNYLSKSLFYLKGKEYKIVENIINTNNALIDNYNQQEITVINPTKRELSRINMSLIKIVVGYYREYLDTIYFKPFEYSERYNQCECSKSSDWCDECIAEDDESSKHYDNNEILNKPYFLLREELKDRCSKTVLSERTYSAKILLHRKNPNYYRFNKLETELNEFLKTEMLKEFIEQNEDFIKSKILVLKKPKV